MLKKEAENFGDLKNIRTFATQNDKTTKHPRCDGHQKRQALRCNSKSCDAKLAKIAQLVEHDLAKVGVAGSSPVFRSTCPGGGIGRRATLRG